MVIKCTYMTDYSVQSDSQVYLITSLESNTQPQNDYRITFDLLQGRYLIISHTSSAKPMLF